MTKIVDLSAEEAGLLLPLLRQVQDLHVSAHPEIFRGDASDREREDFLRALITKTGVTALVCRTEGGTVLGYLIYELQTREASALKVASRIGFLHQIAVDEAHRGTGIGSRLLEAMKSRLRGSGIAKIRSEHFAFNAPSAGLMQAAGMKPLAITVEGDL